MSNINKEEKTHLIENSFHIDKLYMQALECLREELIQKGIDINSGEGRKIFMRAVRKLNERLM